jgi:hypothetical protein
LQESRLAQTLDPVYSIVSRDLALFEYHRREFEAPARAVRPHLGRDPYFVSVY